MQQEDAVHRAHQHVVDLVLLGRHGEHHAHEIGRVRQVVARVDERLPHRVLVRHGDDGRHLRDQPERRDGAVLRIADIERVVVERRKRSHHPDHHRHRVRVAPEPLVQPRQLLVHHRVMRDDADEFVLLLAVGQLAVKQQIAHLEEVAVLRELLDRVAAIQQHAGIAVDEGNRRAAARSRQVARVVGEHSRLRIQRADIDHLGPHAAGEQGKFQAAAIGQLDGRHLFHGR